MLSEKNIVRWYGVVMATPEVLTFVALVCAIVVPFALFGCEIKVQLPDTGGLEMPELPEQAAPDETEATTPANEAVVADEETETVAPEVSETESDEVVDEDCLDTDFDGFCDTVAAPVESDPVVDDAQEVDWCPEVGETGIWNDLEFACETSVIWYNQDNGAGRIRCDGTCILSVYTMDEEGYVEYVRVSPYVANEGVDLRNIVFTGERIDFPLLDNMYVNLVVVDGPEDETVARMMVLRGKMSFGNEFYENGQTSYQKVEDIGFSVPQKDGVIFTFDVVPIAD